MLLPMLQLKIRNDFDPVLSPESSLFVLKSNKQVAYQDILKILDAEKFCSSVQNFIDIYLRIPGIPTNGQLTESGCIRVLIEVDHLQDASPYLQIKGVNKEAVAAAGSMLKLDGTYTTMSYLQIILEGLPAMERSSTGIYPQQAARLQELVEFIQSQGSSSASESSPCREVTPMEGIIEEMLMRIRRLERWHTINTVLWTFLMSALVGYSLYQRKRQ